MIVDFSQINYDEPMPLILKNASEQTLGVLGYAKNRGLDLKYNPVSTLSFELPMRADGIDVPFYDDVVGMRIVEVPGIGQFIINNPEETGDGVHRQKSVEAYSLEYEFTRKKITLGEGTYKFYDDDVDNSLIGMIMELMPAWSIGELASSIKNKYRTFSVENQNLYDFMMNTVQETYGCVFEFDTINRTVSVRDISDEPSQRAVWLSDKNLAKELTITENTDNVYTRLDVNGADGVNIRDVNPDGTNKIVNLDYFMTPENIGSAKGSASVSSRLNVVYSTSDQTVTATLGESNYVNSHEICVSNKNIWPGAATVAMPSSTPAMPGSPRPDMKMEFDAVLPNGSYVLSYHYSGKQPVSCDNVKAVIGPTGSRVYQRDTNMPAFHGTAGNDIEEDVEETISVFSPVLVYTRTYTFASDSDTATISNIMLRPSSISDDTYEPPEYTTYEVTNASASLSIPEGLSVVYCGSAPVNFSYNADLGQTIINKYHTWKTLFDDNKESYYNLSVRYSLKMMQKVTEEANLTDLKNEVVNLDNQRAVTIQAISQGLQTQEALDDINAQMATAQEAVDSKQNEINSINSELNSIRNNLTRIRNTCNFRNYFTDDEWLIIDRYIKDGDVTESTFVAESSGAYMDEGSGSEIENQNIAFNSGEVAVVTDAVGRDMVRLRGGILEIQDVLNANVVTGTIEYYNNNIICSMWLNEGTLDGEYFPSGCLTITGSASGFGTVPNDEGMNNGICTMIVTGYMYFTYDVSEYQKHSVAWDLFEYGEATLNSLAYPSYTFSVSSANFVALPEYIAFRNALRLGERIYLEKSDNVIVRPILIGALLNLDDPMELELEFGDKYSSNDPAQKLVELLGQTVSMGKSVEAGKYTYSSFKDSGAETDIKRRMTSALDVAKNQIINSAGQAVAWDASGLHLREWTNSTETAYKDEQIWMNNTMIAMTDDGWETAKMAIGKFHDVNAGDCWGIVAPTIMGTLIAGESLIIESQKKSGETAVFRMDGDGCRLYNSDFVISRIIDNKTTKIVLSPDFGIAIGDGDLYSVNADTGEQQLDPTHAKFYADDDGNLHITGAIHASELYINDGDEYKNIDEYGAAKFSVTDDQIKASVGNTFAYLKETGIELSATDSIILKSGTTSVVQIDSSGITLNGNAINISNGSTSIALNAAGLTIKTGSGSTSSSVLTIDNNGIDMTSGKFSVFATSNDSVIRFGGTVDSPNFSLGLGGDILANNATFNSISVTSGTLVMSPPGYTAPNVIVSKSEPEGSNIVWIEPNEVSSVGYSSTITTGRTLTSNAATLTFKRTGNLSLGGDSMKCGVRLHLYVYKGNVSNLVIRVDVRPYNTDLAMQTVMTYNCGSMGSESSKWVDTTQSMSNMTEISSINWTNYEQLEVRISCTRSGSGTVQLSSGTLLLKCMNSSTAEKQTCTVHYII